MANEFHPDPLVRRPDWLPCERLLRRFEAAWRRDEAPTLADYLEGEGALRAALLRELIHTDLELRLKRDRVIRAESYLAAYPELTGDATFVLDLLAAEYQLRRASEPDLTAAEYVARFPQYADELPARLGGLSTPRMRPGRGAGPTPTVPGYEILGVLGRGGMGVVYKARQTPLDRVVALKVMRAGADAEPEELARFRTEVEAAAQLQHPNIVQVHEVGTWRSGEGTLAPYCVLEYVDGGSLEAFLNGVPQLPAEAARLVRTLAGAAQYAHEKGVVHRDLKPANVLRTADGVPKIADFGLAKRLGSDAGQTQTGAVVGTPRCMAPEQAAGRTKEVGPAADVYALGVLLYECLTGRPPFGAATALETLEQVLRQEPVAPRLLQSTTPRDLETICLKCLQKSPVARYGSARDLAEDLGRFLAGEPIRARPAGLTERAVKWARRRPAAAALLGTLGLVAFVGLPLLLALWWRAEENYRMADAARQAEVTERQRKDAALAESEINLHFQRVTLADREWWANNATAAEQVLDACDPQRRHWEWHYLKRLCHSEALFLQGHTQYVRAVAYSPDGKRLASAGSDGTVRVWDARTGQVVVILGVPPDGLWDVAYSPDGQLLATAGQDATVRLWDAGTGREVRVLRGHTASLRGLAFSPDGTRLASAGGEGALQKPGEIKVWAVADGREVLDLTGGHALGVQRVAWRPDGKQLATAGLEGWVVLWDAATGKKTHRLQGHDTAALTSPTYSPNSRLLAVAGADGVVRVWDARTGSGPIASYFGHAGRVTRLAFSPDGQRLASGAADRTARVWDVRTGRELLTLRGHALSVAGVTFSPDGTRLAAVTDKVVKVWDITTPQEALTFRADSNVTALAYSPEGDCFATSGSRGEVSMWDAKTGRSAVALRRYNIVPSAVGYSRDGRRLAAGGNPGTVHVWDTPSGQGRCTLVGHKGWVSSVAFHPDGRRLVSTSVALPPRKANELKVWEIATLRETAGPREPVETALRAVFSPDGARLACACEDGTVRVWETAGYREILVFREHTDKVVDVAYSPDGRRVASAGRDNRVYVWDAATGQVLHTLRGHTGAVCAVGFSADGSRLASGSGDGDVKVWDVVVGREALTLRGHTGDVKGVAFSPDGTRLVSADSNGTVKIWNATPLRRSEQ